MACLHITDAISCLLAVHEITMTSCTSHELLCFHMNKIASCHPAILNDRYEMKLGSVAALCWDGQRLSFSVIGHRSLEPQSAVLPAVMLLAV